MPARNPSAGLPGVDGVLVVTSSPESSSNATTSVNVPPVSMPMRIRRAIVPVYRTRRVSADRATGRRPGCSARRRRTSAWRAGSAEVAVGHHDPLLVVERPGDDLARPRGDDGGAAPAEDLACRGAATGSRRGSRPLDELRHRDHERARLDGDVPDRGLPAVGVVGGRRQPDLRPALVDRPSRQRHPVLPADEPADPPEPRVDDVQVVAGADAVEQALVVGRHQLAVPVAGRRPAQDQQRVVDAPGPVQLALVDADGAQQVVLAAGVDEPVDGGRPASRRAAPEALPGTRRRPRPAGAPRRTTGRATGTSPGTPRARHPGRPRRRAARAPCRGWPPGRAPPAWPGPRPPSRRGATPSAGA